MVNEYVCYFLLYKHLVQCKHYLERAASYLKNMDFHGTYFGIIAN